MRAVVQRVDGASVRVRESSGELNSVGEIAGLGLLVLVGVTHTDTPDHAAKLAAKVHDLRIFDRDLVAEHGLRAPDDSGAELSASDLGLPVLVVSQFTLYGDVAKGRRPSWTPAAPGPIAEPLVAEVVRVLRERGAEVQTGQFGADMRVSLINSGPFTILLEI